MPLNSLRGIRDTPFSPEVLVCAPVLMLSAESLESKECVQLLFILLVLRVFWYTTAFNKYFLNKSASWPLRNCKILNHLFRNPTFPLQKNKVN